MNMKKLNFTLFLLLVTLTATKAWAIGGVLTGIGTSANPYLINDLADWNTFASLLNDGTTAADYVDKYYKLGADIGTSADPVTVPASEYGNNPFRGNFNGNGHTITVALTRTTIPEGDEHLQGLALFHYVGSGCNIHDLNVTGTVNTCGKFGAGFIAFISKGSSSDDPKIVSISRCRSSVVITSTVTGDATSAGFVGASKNYVNLVLNNCRFDGAFVSSTATQFCGMVGWQEGAGCANMLNCIVKPGTGMSLTAPNGNHYTYCRYGGDSFGILNSYYYAAIGTEQGNAVGDMSNEDLKNALGAAWLVQDEEVLPYAISYHYTLIDHYTATDYYVPKNILPDNGRYGYDKLVDGNKSTFWEVLPIDWTPIYINFQSEMPFVPKGYVLTMAPDIQDNPNHNPIEWYLIGKNADGHWEEIDFRGEWQYGGGGEYLPAMNSAEKVYVLTDNTHTYQQFQFGIIRVGGLDNLNLECFELAELQLFGLLDNNNLANACISGVEDYYMWDNGNSIEVNCTVTDYDGTVLTEGIDYNQTITNIMGNIVSEVTDAGSYTLTVTGTGNESQGYFGTQSVGFTVTDHPTGLSVDYSIPEGTIGRYYINLPKNQQTIIDLNTMTPPFTTPFKVYDDGGRDHNFSKGCTEDLLVVAPEGYVIQVCGTIDVGDETLLEFYDGTWGENLMAGNFNRCIGDNIGFFITTGPQLAIKYNTSTATSRAGLDLTVMAVPANTTSAITIRTSDNGSVTASVNGNTVTSATVGDLVTLTAAPDAGYLPNDFVVTDAHGESVTVTGSWYTGNTATFIMPGSEVTVSPNFVPITVTPNNPIQLSVDLPRYSNTPSDALVATIPDNVECFKVYDNGGPNNGYSYSSNGYLLLVAPENKVIQLSTESLNGFTIEDLLEVYDGNTTDYSLGGPYTCIDELGILTSTGNQMLLHFICNNTCYEAYSGLDLVARVYDTTDEFAITVTTTEYGTVAIDPASGHASVSSTVTLTFTPNEGYTGYRPMDFVTNYPSVVVEGGWYSNNVMTFPMPSGPVIITPNYTSATTAEDGLFVNMPKKNTYATSRMVNVPVGISSFKVYDDGGPDDIFSDFCDGYMILTAPENNRLRLTGTVMCEQGLDYLEVYDGNTTDQLIGTYGYCVFSWSQSTLVGQDIDTIYSSGRSLLLHFKSNNWNQFSLDDGLDLKVETMTLPSPYYTFSNFTATAGQNGYSLSEGNESWDKLVDGDINTVWRTHNYNGNGFRKSWVEFEYSEAFVPTKYNLTMGNQVEQHPGRLPKSWVLMGKLNSADEWTTIASVMNDNALLPMNYYTVEFSLADNNKAFKYFRYEVLAVQGHEPHEGSEWDDYAMELSELSFYGYRAVDIQNDLTYAIIEGVNPRYVYTGGNINVNYSVKDPLGNPLTENVDYLCAISPNPVKQAGDYALTVSPKPEGGYIGHQVVNFKITDYPMNVDVDDDYVSPDQLGYYYSDMPKEGIKFINLARPVGFTKSIKIYDDGGKSGNYSKWYNGGMLLHAPEGYVLQLTGTVTSKTDVDYLTVYDGSNTGANIMGMERFGNDDGEDIGTLTTTGPNILLFFTSSAYGNYSGLNLVLSMISTTENRAINFDYNVGGTVTATPNPANVGSTVTLTPNSNPGYLIYDFIAKDTYDHDLDVKGSWYDTFTFTMPGNEVTVTPISTHRISFLGGLYINMNDTITVNIPQEVTSFKVYDNGGKDGDYHAPCSDLLVLNAPEGYVLRVEGTGKFGSTGAWQWLKIFDGGDCIGTYEGSNYVRNIGPNTTQSNQMQILFNNDNTGYPGYDLTVTVYNPNTWSGNGSEGSPYEISSLEGLQTLAAYSEVFSYEGSHFKLTADIGTAENPFRKVIGDNADHPFCGIFDGNGHTITVALSNGNTFSGDDEAEQGSALFHYVGDGCVIKNLTVDGTLTTANKFGAGFIAYIKPGEAAQRKAVTLTNCHSGIEITSTHAGDNTSGGFIGLAKEYVDLNLDKCVFDGAFSSTEGTRFSGFVGFLSDHNNTTITNSIMMGDASGLAVTDGEHYTFCRHHNNITPTFTGSNYYHTAIGTPQGTQAYRLTLPVGITAFRDTAPTMGNGIAYLYSDGFYMGDCPYFTATADVVIGPSTTNFVITSPIVNYGDGISWPANPGNNGFYWFFMPDDDVTITATMGVQCTVAGYGDSTESDHWVFLANPTTEDVTPSTDNHLIVVPESEYDLYRFNQSAEAEWENFKVHYADHTFRTLTHGRGYLYARKNDATLTFSGTFLSTDSHEVDLAYDANAEAKGWNLVGNPYPMAAYADRPYYRMNANGSDLEAVADYATTPIDACSGIMVQAEEANEAITFTTLAPEAQSSNGSLSIGVAERNETPTRGGSLLDKAIVSFNEGEQLGKFVFNESHTQLYLLQNGDNYAVAYSMKQGEMPLNFKAAKNGSYTLSLDLNNAELGYLHLIDNITGTDVDLLQMPEYSFDATTGDSEQRFSLVFEDNGELPGAASFAYFNGSEWIINHDGEAQLQVIDVMGRIVASHSGHIRRLSTAGMAPGVYVLRLINNDKVRTQKIIVR